MKFARYVNYLTKRIYAENHQREVKELLEEKRRIDLVLENPKTADLSGIEHV